MIGNFKTRHFKVTESYAGNQTGSLWILASLCGRILESFLDVFTEKMSAPLYIWP